MSAKQIAEADAADRLTFQPLTPERWPDLEALFGRHGATGGCWCMWWRLTQAEFDRNKGQSNKEALKLIVDSGQVPGLLAYVGAQPVGWCAIAPRETFPRLDRSRVLKPVDDAPVWSVVCFFVARPYRRRGVTVQLLHTAVDYAREQRAAIVEGYPVEPKAGSTPDVFAYTGLATSFRRAGFLEVARRSETRPIMRYVIDR